MAATRPTLFDLFGDLTAAWPVELVREHTGHPLGGPPSPAVWLAALNNSVRVGNVRTGALPDRVALKAELTVEPGTGFLGYPDGWPFVIASMPDVEFRIRPFQGSGRLVRLLASAADAGFELLLEQLPIEIRLPAGLVQPHADEPARTVGSFTPGDLDDLRIAYERDGPTSILVHVRLHVTDAGEIHIQPAVPVSFGRCSLSGIPCKAVHDFRLIPSPGLVGDHYEWIRHAVTPWLPDLAGPYDGLFAARSIHLDDEAEAFRDIASKLNPRAVYHPAAELVLDDLVVPFFGPLGMPVPRHVTTGVRRRALDPGSDPVEVFRFDHAPVHVTLGDDPGLAFILESLFFRSQPTEGFDVVPDLVFDAAIVLGDEQSPPVAFAFGLEEEFTLVTGIDRSLSADGTPEPGTGPAAALYQLLHWEIAGSVIVDIMGFRNGFSLGRKFGAGLSVGDSLLIVVDLFVQAPPTGEEGADFRLRGLDGERVAFAIEGLGWRFGGFHIEGVALPDGVVAWFGPLGLVLAEIGLVAEDGASYLTMDAGVAIKASGFEGGLTMRRMRFRVFGNESRPAFKVDGFFLFVRTDTVSVEAGGFYRREIVDGSRVREFGLSGTVEFELNQQAYLFGLDLLYGDRRNPQAPAEDFSYLMFQAFFQAQIGPIGYFELTGARVLFASNVRPLLEPVDRESRELRYYSWYRGSNPLTVEGDRRLASWQVENDAWAVGIGAGASLASCGAVFHFTVFVLGLGGPSEGGFLIVGEAFVLASPTAVGYLAVEWDGRNDRFCLVTGVSARTSTFMEDAPAWLDDVGTLAGSLFVSNDPATFAIGRLADQHTWLELRSDIDAGLRLFVLLALCLEIVEGPTGPKGFGFVARIESGLSARPVVQLKFHAGLGFVMQVFRTGSSDFAVVAWIELGLRFVLFGFLRIGISARAELRAVGRRPSRGELTLELRLETPWFLPDVTWTFELVFGELQPADLATAVQPLRSAAADEGATRGQLPAHVERFDPSWTGDGAAPLHSVNELAAPTRPEADRLANLAADAALQPVATDATIAVAWNMAVNDRLALGSGIATGHGDQGSGDLALSYELVGLAVRRRARFGTDRSWKPLEQRMELGADFSDPAGVRLNGSFAPQVLHKTWDLDVQIGGEPAPKKLLINAVAPYEFATANPETDERLADRHPGWPCCETGDKLRRPRLHELDFRARGLGEELAAPTPFSASASLLRLVRPAWAREVLGGGLPAGTVVAAVEFATPGPIARADLDEDAASCAVRLAWPATARVTLVGFDGAGNEVARRELGPGTGNHKIHGLDGAGPIRRLELRAFLIYSGPPGTEPLGAATLEVDWVAYVGLRDVLDGLVADEVCDGGTPGGPAPYEGEGKLAFLSNHEYEIAVTTRVTIAHPSTPAAAADVEEFVYFRTKGLPGLNAVAVVGEELAPYVRAAYAGGRGLVYREEPVTLAFADDFFAAVPLPVRPPGTSDEQTTLLRMQLLVAPDVAAGHDTAFTASADDWITANRALATIDLDGRPWKPVASTSSTTASGMISADPAKQRLAGMTQRPAAECELADPTRVVGTALVAEPQGTPDPLAAPPVSTQLWAARTRFTASVRAEAAGFVDRRPFVDGDESAFAFATASGPSASPAWSVVNGELRVSGAPPARRFAIFGETDWDHLTLVTGIVPGAASAGVGSGIPGGGGAPRGLFALVEADGSTARLVVRRRAGGGALAEQDAVPLPADVATGSSPVVLEVTAFDDRLRASVGEAIVEVERGDIREGRLCLTSEGAAAFTSLQVRGLDMYTFPFQTSRFRSFTEHIGSWRGDVDAIAPQALGPGTTTSTVAALWTASASEVDAAMSPAADSAEREQVFARWVKGLGLPLKDDVTVLELSRFTEAARTCALLIESPEPLDFAAEISTTLVFRQPVIDTPVRDAVPSARGMRVELDPALAHIGAVAVAVVERDGGVRLYRGRVGPSSGADLAATVDAEPAGVLARPPADGSPLASALATARVGSVLVLDRDLGAVVGVLNPSVEDVPVDVRLIQSGDARRALVVPVSGAAAVALSPGRYRLELALVRKRWETTDPDDELNTYRSSATLALGL